MYQMEVISFSLHTTGFSKIYFIIFLFVLGAECILSQQVLEPKLSILSTQMRKCRLPKLRGNLYLKTSCKDVNDDCELEPESEVTGNATIVALECSNRFIRKNEIDFTVCMDGIWHPKIEPCLRSCNSIDQNSNVVNDCTFDGRKVECNGNLREGTEVRWRCKDGFVSGNKNRTNYCLKSGRWEFPTPQCTREKRRAFAWIEPIAENVAVGSTVSVKCNVTGYPIPNVTFYKDGKPLTEGDKLKFMNNQISEVEVTVMLTLIKTFFSDNGIYVCQAENELGSSSDSTTVSVLGPISINKFSSISKMISYSSTVDIDCTVTVAQIPITIVWSTELVDSRDKLSAKELVCDGNATLCLKGNETCEKNITCKSTLSVKSPTPQDSGTYTCEARNDVSKDAVPMSLTIEHLVGPHNSYRMTLEVAPGVMG